MDFFGLPIDQSVVLFVLMIFVGFIESISGGGALIIVPLLLSLDVNYVDAMYTTKIIGCVMLIFMSVYFKKQKLIQFKENIIIFIVAFTGGGIGAYFLTIISTENLEIIIPFILVIILIYFIKNNPKKDAVEIKVPKLSKTLYCLFCSFPIGIYDGFLGPASGTMYIATLIEFYGLKIKNAVAMSKFLNTGTMLGAISVFIYNGNHFVVSVGIIQIVSMGIGTFIGAKLVVNKGERITRPMILFLSMLMLIHFVYKKFT